MNILICLVPIWVLFMGFIIEILSIVPRSCNSVAFVHESSKWILSLRLMEPGFAFVRTLVSVMGRASDHLHHFRTLEAMLLKKGLVLTKRFFFRRISVSIILYSTLKDEKQKFRFPII